MTNNIVHFPKTKKDSPPQSFEEMYLNIQSVRKERIEIAVYEIVPIISELLFREGFDLEKTEYLKDSALIIESIRSALCRIYGLDHELQELADKSFQIQLPTIDDIETSESTPQANNQI
jgi:hypothetical protein